MEAEPQTRKYVMIYFKCFPGFLTIDNVEFDIWTIYVSAPRNVSVLHTNIWISIFKWIRNDGFKLNIKGTEEKTLQHSIIPLFWGDTLYIYTYLLGIYIF